VSRFRSTLLKRGPGGTRPRARRAACLLAIALVATSASGCSRALYNFGAVESGRIYRAAQPSPLFLRWLVSRYQIRTLVNLRGRTRGFESAFAARNGLRLYSFRLSSTRPPSPDEVERFLDVVSDPENQPVLVHCRGGVDRSGYMLGIYRLERSGWSRERAVREMNRFLQFEWRNPVPQQVVRDGLRDGGGS
jgi:protein tyrosine/serine phosphatase